jgi:hypothetical protein
MFGNDGDHEDDYDQSEDYQYFADNYINYV